MKHIALLLSLLIINCVSIAQADSTASPTESNTVPETTFDTDDGEDLSDFKPIVSLSGGMLTYFGDLSVQQKANGILLSNLAMDIGVSFPLKNSFYLTLRTMLGKVSANERSNTFNRNFSSRVQTFGLEVSYNFNHFLNESRIIDPYLSAGFDALVFNSKTDLFDANGNQYYYWSTGDIKDQPENNENIVSAQEIYRDYVYETDFRESGITGAGYYEKYSFAIPFGAGVNMRLSHKFHAHLGATYNILLTDRIDGVSKEGKGIYNGSGKLDGILYSHIGISYDLSNHGITKDKEEDKISDEDLAELAEGDSDLDGVANLNDECPQTPAGVEVDEKGCPFDDDNDGVPDYRDLELGTDSNAVVDTNGVGLTDEQIEMIALRFLDESGALSIIEDTIYTNELPDRSQRKYNSKYSVQVSGDSLSAAQASDLLSSEKLKSVKDGDKSTILVGEYDDLSTALAKNKELKDKGINTRSIVEETVTGKVITADTRGVFVGASAGKKAATGTLFRIQVGAFSKPLAKNAFEGLDVIGIKSSDGITRYYTGNYSSYNDAAAARVKLKGQGYVDCLVKAFNEGEQVSLSSVGATFVPTSTPTQSNNEPLPDNIDKSKVRFKIQLGSYRNTIPMDQFNKFVKLGSIKHEQGSDGLTRYFVGAFNSYAQAEAFKNELSELDVQGAFVVGEYNGKTITAKKAKDLLK